MIGMSLNSPVTGSRYLRVQVQKPTHPTDATSARVEMLDCMPGRSCPLVSIPPLKELWSAHGCPALDFDAASPQAGAECMSAKVAMPCLIVASVHSSVVYTARPIRRPRHGAFRRERRAAVPGAELSPGAAARNQIAAPDESFLAAEFWATCWAIAAEDGDLHCCGALHPPPGVRRRQVHA